MANPIFTSTEGQAKLESWYQQFLKRIPGPVSHRDVLTSTGRNHVLVAGNPDGPPLVVLHGALASSAHLVHELTPLLEHYCIYAPDVPGQSIRAVPLRLDIKSDAYARWLRDLTDAMGLKEFHLLGVSWGGFVARQAAVLMQDRVKKLVLVVPAGFVNGNLVPGLTKLMMPMMAYRKNPSPERLKKFLSNILTTLDDDWFDYMGEAFQSFELDFRPPPLAKPEDFKGYRTPTLVFAAEEDLSFPGDKLLARVKEVMPAAQTELIKRSKHSPPTTPEFRKWMGERLHKFLSA